jgi:dihydrodipicolinate synthase/N-acetylneuraminate lyase
MAARSTWPRSPRSSTAWSAPASAGSSRAGQSYPAAVKTACRLAGDTTGPVRAPLLPLDDAATGELAALLEHATLAGAAG